MNKSSQELSQGLPYEFAVKNQFTNELQWHSDFCVFFILQGKLNVSLSGRGHLLNQNDLFFLEPYQTFSVITHSDNLRLLHLVISARFIRDLVWDFDAIQFKTHYIRHNDYSDEYKAICEGIGQITLHSIKEGSCEHLKCVAAVSKMMTTFIEAFGEKNAAKTTQDDSTTERIRTIIRYINENYEDRITLDAIAAAVGLHPQYFTAFFKKQFHQTFVEFLTHYRIYRSIAALINSDDSILTIAVANGFGNHKTYGTAFKKLLDVSPQRYRQTHAHTQALSETDSEALQGMFQYFQQFWNQPQPSESGSNQLQRHQTVSFDLTRPQPGEFHNDRPFFVDAGRASSCLRVEIQELIRMAKTDLGFHYLRMRDIFSDDLFVYHEEADKLPVFNWQYIDIIIDFLRSIDVKPFFEIGFMPRQLASKKQYAGWNFQPNVSFPKSIEKWMMLVSTFIRHCLARYGASDVHTWYFDFWVCPDLQIHNGYWNESMEKFFEFYLATYRAVKGVSPQIQIGSPTFSTPSGLSWYEAFFDFCHTQSIDPAFISAHMYSINITTDRHEFVSYSSTRDADQDSSDKTSLLRQVSAIKAIMATKGYQDKPLLLSHWNVSFLPRDLSRDTSFMGPYFTYNQSALLREVNGMCFRSLSDVNEDFFPHSSLFHGGAGMLDFYGIKKPVYYAFQFFTRLGRTILYQSDNTIIAKSERGYQVLMFYLSYYDSLYRYSDQSALSYMQRYNIYEATEHLQMHLILTVEPGQYSIKKSNLNRQSGSAYDLWVNMGAPENPSPSVIEYIKNKSTPDILYANEDVSANLYLDANLEPHEVMLIEIEPVL